MSAVVTICKRKIHALIKAHIHRTANQSFDRLDIVVDRIFYILDLAAIGQIPESFLQILFLNRSDILRHMAVEGIRHILSVGNALDNAVLIAELFHLQSAKVLCRSTINCVKVAVLLLELIHTLIDIFHYLQGKLTVLNQRFAVVELLQLVQCSDTKACSCGTKEGLDLV